MEQIGRYRILGELGKGAMGVVYRAEDPSIGRIVAIKTIRLADASSERERKFLKDRLFREARSAGILKHPGIVTIYDIQEQGDFCYVFMEYVDGPSLEKLMSQEALANHRVLDILQQTAVAMDYAHSKGIVHRDIKPGNIMLDSSGTVKITDFGVAKFTSQQATNTGVLLGTPSYMSPEQISDRAVTGASDQFSLAVIAYELLTGERPFSGPTLPSLMFKIVNDEPAVPSRLNASLGPGVDYVLQKGLAKEASARYPNCAQFAKALVGACEARPNWHPMRAGSVESVETVADEIAPRMLAAQAPAASSPTPAPPTSPAADSAEASFEDETLPAPRKGRSWLWVALIAAGLVGAGFGARTLFLSNDGEAAEVAEQQVQRAPVDESRPSAMGPAVRKAEPPPPETAPTETPESTETKPAVEPPPPVAEPRAPAPDRKKADERESAPQAESPVRIVTNPPGAKVTFDGTGPVCTSPCSLPLAGGRHTLVAVLEGYRTESRIFQVPSEAEQILVLDRTFGTLMIRSTPAGAAIFVDGKERREKTPAVLTLPVGKRKVTITREGRREEQEIEIKDGAVTNLDVSWAQ
ncbi:MAG: serine/threonine protein kinase [Bryobacterales bacterium]|nr:serine/threonine protein kinase [Bryobacterales bacterium]